MIAPKSDVRREIRPKTEAELLSPSFFFQHAPSAQGRPFVYFQTLLFAPSSFNDGSITHAKAGIVPSPWTPPPPGQ